jgi:excisionase family DNA binding protein
MAPGFSTSAATASLLEGGEDRVNREICAILVVEMSMATTTASKVQLLTTQEAAELLRVSPRTVQNWIKRDQVPFLELPGGEYRLPLAGLLESLKGSFDLGQALRDLDAASGTVSETDIAAALGE